MGRWCSKVVVTTLCCVVLVHSSWEIGKAQEQGEREVLTPEAANEGERAMKALALKRVGNKADSAPPSSSSPSSSSPPPSSSSSSSSSKLPPLPGSLGVVEKGWGKSADRLRMEEEKAQQDVIAEKQEDQTSEAEAAASHEVDRYNILSFHHHAATKQRSALRERILRTHAISHGSSLAQHAALTSSSSAHSAQQHITSKHDDTSEKTTLSEISHAKTEQEAAESAKYVFPNNLSCALCFVPCVFLRMPHPLHNPRFNPRFNHHSDGTGSSGACSDATRAQQQQA
eukprot:867384-Rhodomonas_salina.2